MQKIVLSLALLPLVMFSGCSNDAPTQTQSPATAAENTRENTAAGAVLPFPEPSSASVAGKTLADSKHQWRKADNHLPPDAPNIVIS